MLKPLHIICLFALLGVGLVGCEERECNDIVPQSEQFIVIKDTTDYNEADFYINHSVVIAPSNSFVLVDVDGDGSPDLKFTRKDSSATNYIYVGTKLYNLNPDSLSFSSYYPYLNQPNVTEAIPHMFGDTASSSLLWTNYAMINLGWMENDNGYESGYVWGSVTQGKVYCAFRKRVGPGYKYGWIKINGGFYGPSVMQR